MPAPFLFALAASCAVMMTAAAPARPPYYAPGCLCDPVVTHTNGMRLASSQAHRSHNVYWRCDEGHVGYCSGRYYAPFRNDWRSLGTRYHGRFEPPRTPVGPTARATSHSQDGIEDVSGETLGTIQPIVGPLPANSPLGASGRDRDLASFGGAMMSALSREQSPPPESKSGSWVDAINEIGRKMMEPSLSP